MGLQFLKLGLIFKLKINIEVLNHTSSSGYISIIMMEKTCVYN